MKFKMRILHFSPDGNAQKIAEAIAKAQVAGSDKIPPAYPVENEKLLFIGYDAKSAAAPKDVANLCKDLTTARAKNVAFFAVGSKFDGINELKQIVSSKGINVLEAHECAVKGGLFSKGSVSDDNVKAAVAWADKLVNSLV